MFNVLFGSFFGKGKENNSNKSEESDNCYSNCDKTLSEQFEAGNVKFIDLDDEDIDWLLIEKDDQESEEKTNSDSPCLALVPFKSVFAARNANDDGENILLSSNLPCVYSNSMDDSWFLTPPECFTSLSTIQLESSPLENLLIEHPSMSVYGKLRKKSLTNAEVFDDLVIVELGGAQNKMITSTSEHQGKKIKKSRSSGAIPKIPTATIYVVKNNNNTNNNNNSRAKSNNQGKSAFERNNKLHLLRHAPKRTTLNQPSSRMMMTINKKK